MDNQQILQMLPEALLPWFERSQRDLPWRADKDPYHIWLSEIMLQQTRVEAVRGYYTRFLQALPTISDLSNADEALLHKLWEGLGYYSRVRNLKKSAQVIMTQYGGVFPNRYEEILALPGIGEYTAGAICSIAFDQPTPAVDGNVLRVFARLTDDATPIDKPAYKKQVQSALRAVYPSQAGAFTQSLMELGATLCGPNRKPQCENCPCRTFCRANINQTAQNLPVRLPKRSRRTEELTVFILNCDGKYALRKRTGNGLLANLWEFPNVVSHLSLDQAIAYIENMGIGVKDIVSITHKKHIFTHIQWDMRGVYLNVSNEASAFAWLNAQEIQKEAALPTAFRQFWEQIYDR